MGSACAPRAILTPSRARANTAPFSQVVVHRTALEAEAAWAKLEGMAPISGYQTRKWLIPWMETVGCRNGGQCMLVVASAPNGEPVAMLPLWVVRRSGLTKACFMGKRDVNLNLGLFAPGIDWSQRDLQSLLRRAARVSRAGIHMFDLQNQPEAWNGVPNPLTCLPHTPSPSFSALGRLNQDPDAFFAARGSRETRKTLAKKARRLANHFGPLRHVVASDTADVQTILETFRAQKTAVCTMQDSRTCSPMLRSCRSCSVPPWRGCRSRL